PDDLSRVIHGKTRTASQSQTGNLKSVSLYAQVVKNATVTYPCGLATSGAIGRWTYRSPALRDPIVRVSSSLSCGTARYRQQSSVPAKSFFGLRDSVCRR